MQGFGDIGQITQAIVPPTISGEILYIYTDVMAAFAYEETVGVCYSGFFLHALEAATFPQEAFSYAHTSAR